MSSKRRERGQVAAEFIIVFSLALLVFVILQAFYFQQRFRVQEEAASADAQKLADKLAFLVEAVSYRQGFNASYAVPIALETGEQFEFRVANTSAAISWNNKTVSSAFGNIRVVNGSGQQNFPLQAGNYYVVSSAEEVVLRAA